MATNNTDNEHTNDPVPPQIVPSSNEAVAGEENDEESKVESESSVNTVMGDQNSVANLLVEEPVTASDSTRGQSEHKNADGNEAKDPASQNANTAQSQGLQEVTESVVLRHLVPHPNIQPKFDQRALSFRPENRSNDALMKFRRRIFKTPASEQAFSAIPSLFSKGCPIAEIATLQQLEDPQILISALQNEKISHLTSLQYATLTKYNQCKQRHQALCQKLGQSRVMPFPDITLSSGYGTGKVVAYLLVLLDHLLSVRKHVRMSLDRLPKVAADEIDGSELATGSCYAIVLVPTRPDVFQLEALASRFFSESKISVKAASDYEETNTKGTNKEAIWESKAHVLIATLGRLDNLRLDDVTDREIHLQALGEEVPQDEWDEMFLKALSRTGYFVDVSAIIVHNAFEFFSNSGWQQGLTAIRERLWPLCMNDVGFVFSTAVFPDMAGDETISSWLKQDQPAKETFTVTQIEPEADDPFNTTSCITVDLDPSFVRTNMASSNCYVPSRSFVLNAIGAMVREAGNKRVLVIAGTRDDVDNVYAHVTHMHDGAYATRTRCMHGGVLKAANVSAQLSFQSGQASVLIATGGFVAELEMDVEHVFMAFWGWQENCKAETILSWVALTGRLGKPGSVRMFFCAAKDDVIAFSRIVFHMFNTKQLVYNQGRWLRTAKEMVENLDSLDPAEDEELKIAVDRIQEFRKMHEVQEKAVDIHVAVIGEVDEEESDDEKLL